MSLSNCPCLGIGPGLFANRLTKEEQSRCNLEMGQIRLHLNVICLIESVRTGCNPNRSWDVQDEFELE